MVLICLFLCRSVSLSLFFFPSSSSAYAPILISISSIVLRLISSSLFPSRLHPLLASQYRPDSSPSRLHLHPPSFSPSRPHPLPVSLPLNLTLCLASAGLFMSSAYAPIFIPLRCLSLSFCILNCPYPASFPFLALRSIPPGLLLYLIFHFLPATQSCHSSFSFSSGLYFCAPDVLPVANIVFLPPPLIWLKRQFVLF